MAIRQLGGLTRRRIVAGIALGAMAGMAVGQNVTIPWPTVTYKGAVEFMGSISNGCTSLYTVPAGLKLRLTSFLIDTRNSPLPIPYQFICSGNAKGDCVAPRTNYITAPTGNTFSMALTSGILFNPGEIVQACSDDPRGANVTSWTFYGFLYR